MTSQSKLRPFLEEANGWLESDISIDDAISRSEEFIAESNIRPQDKTKMLDKVSQWKWTDDGTIPPGANKSRKVELVKYLYYSLLYFEGLGVVK